MTRSYTNYYFYTGTPEQDGKLEEAEKRELLLAPLSETQQESAVSYVVELGHLAEWQTTTLASTLDEIERMTQDRDERLAVLTSADELGQTPFLKALEAGSAALFDILAERLRQWGGESYANDWLKSFLAQPLGMIDHGTAGSLQTMAQKKEGLDRDRLIDLSDYQPAGYTHLKALVVKVHPLITEYLDRNPQMDAECAAKLRKLAEDPDAVKPGPSVLACAFPGAMFDRLLDLQQKLDRKSPEQLADDIVKQLSMQNGNGNTAMHRVWQGTIRRSTPGSASDVRDLLAPVIAGFEKRLGTEIAIDMTARLLSLKNEKGALPLGNEHSYQEPEIRNYYIGGFLMNLRKELGSQEKFDMYMSKAISPVLPKDFSTGKPKPETAVQPSRRRRGTPGGP